MLHTPAQRWIAFTLLMAGLLVPGCSWLGDEVHYLGPPHQEPYRDIAQRIEYPAVDEPSTAAVEFTDAPRTLDYSSAHDVWEMPLAEAVYLALLNNDVIRSGGAFVSRFNPILSSPDAVPTVYDPAIQETGILIGNRGIEAALSDFDANFTTRMLWGRDEVLTNNPFLSSGVAGGTLTSETGDFNATLSKQMANGGQFSLGHQISYLGSNSAFQVFPSTYAGTLSATYRQPLLAGAGTEYTRIAGPIGRNITAVGGVAQGVLIARINSDIELADFEASVRNLLRDVEDAYWDLYVAYRSFDAAASARNATMRVWRVASAKLEVGHDLPPYAEAQARDQLFESQIATDNARSAIYEAETRLRRLLGLNVNDGRVIRPTDEPITARVVPDWTLAVSEALTERVELRRQKWRMKSLELQLRAAESQLQPRLDFLASYRVNGFGDDLIAQNESSTFYKSITNNEQTGWNLGFEMTMPIGFRTAKSQVRNLELQLARARRVLETQELEVSHELANSFQRLARSYQAAELSLNRVRAAREYVSRLEARSDRELNVDLLLRAQRSAANAEVAYYSNLVDYNRALADLHFRKGTLLKHYDVHLMEGPWTPPAYTDSHRRREARMYGLNVDPRMIEEAPEPFALPAPIGNKGVAVPGSILPAPTEDAPPVEPPAVPSATQPLEAPDRAFPQSDVPEEPVSQREAATIDGDPFAVE
ncbi:TolC family protein [Maioricimonas sp. JC845]|uniref:TolC family protein n=1 Tax=Maioricimonas sp. JC845 TaxID=3232138 RepID=UPI00345A20A7